VTSLFILGSGFSKAVNDAMPTVVGLSTAAEAFLEEEKVTPLLKPSDFDDFEVWLSYLAVEQPALMSHENLENRALFYRTSVWLGRYLSRQQRLPGQQPPEWLTHLIGAWHRDESAVLTFNYDTIVESSITKEAEGDSFVDYSYTYVVSIPYHFHRTGGAFGRERDKRTFKLHKLHGSINWYYSGADSYYGESPYDVQLPVVWSAEELDDDVLEERVPGRIPLIVPPTVAKSGYFENETVRAIWKSARKQLSSATDIYLLGYSLPNSDLMMRGLLAETCVDKNLWPVNRDENIGAHLRQILPRCSIRDDYVRKVEPIPSFVRLYVDC
jgi:hypothetical protein